jgi:hypothetical protein
MTDPSGQKTPEAQLKPRRDAEAWERGNAAEGEARREKKAKEERRREARRRLSWLERLDFFLDALEEWAKIVVVFGTIFVAGAAVAVLVIGAFVDLQWR